MKISRNDTKFVRLTNCNNYAPLTNLTPNWNRKGKATVSCVIGKTPIWLTQSLHHLLRLTGIRPTQRAESTTGTTFGPRTTMPSAARSLVAKASGCQTLPERA